MKMLRSIIFLLPAFGWFFWSFILTDHALLYSTNSLFLRFQNFLWLLAPQHALMSYLYVGLLILLFGLYGVVLKSALRTKKLHWHVIALPVAIFYLLFALSNPALSYDLFNYMFDAKLVMVYHLDPHVTSAISFMGKDDWVRFMRNVFFPTTYGYMWTGLSLVPFVLGLGKFLTIFLAFKLYMLFALGLLFFLSKYIFSFVSTKNENMPFQLALFFCSPLVLIESLSSAHNDVWMMVLAFASLALLLSGNILFKETRKHTKNVVALLIRVIISFALLYASSSVKRSTALLLPVWVFFACGLFVQFVRVPSWVEKKYLALGPWWADVCALLLFAPLFTELSRQFQPWYLVWALSFLPFVRSKLLRVLLICFSISSTLRYLPVLYTGQYTPSVEATQRMITWSAIPVALLVYGLLYLRSRARKHA